MDKLKAKRDNVCFRCGLNPQDQHSNRTGGICDFLRSLNLTFMDEVGKQHLHVLMSGGRVKLS